MDLSFEIFYFYICLILGPNDPHFGNAVWKSISRNFLINTNDMEMIDTFNEASLRIYFDNKTENPN